MFKLKYIKVKNIVVYKEAYFEFKQGISIVTGENGRGKSLLFSLLSTILYDENIITGKKEATNLLTQSEQPEQPEDEPKAQLNFSIQTSTQEKEDDYILNYYPARSLKIQILKNKQDMKFETTTKAREYLNTLKIPSDLFFSSVYLSSYRPNTLIYGNFTQRFEFFESIFDFSKIDLLQDATKKEIQKLEATKIQKETIQKEIESLKKEQDELLKTGTAEVMESKIKDIQKTIKQKEAQRDQNTKIFNSLGLLVRELEKINTLKGKIKDTPDTTNFSDAILKELHYKKEQDAKDIKYYSDVLVRVQNIKKMILTVQEQKKTIQEQTKQEQELIKQLPKETENKTEINDEIIKVNKTQAIIDHKLQARSKLNTTEEYCTCEVCGSKIPAKDIQQEIKELQDAKQKNIKLLEELNKQMKQQQDEQKKINELKQNLNTIQSKIKDNTTTLQQNEAKFEKASIDIKDAKNDYKQDLLNIQTIEKEVQKDIEALNNKQDIIKLKALQENYKEMVKNIKENTKDIKIEPDTTIEVLKQQHEHIKEQTAKVINELYDISKTQKEIEIKLALLKNNTSKIADKTKQIDKISIDLQSLDYYLFLESSVFGAKGYKEYKLKNDLMVFEKVVNQYTPFLFDDMSFNFILEKRSISIQAIRKGQQSDINKLSGSESRRFTLLMMIAVLALVNKKERSDTVILDELDAGMDDRCREKFYNEFIPQLQQIIPNIVLITPCNVPEEIQCDRYEVIKDVNINKSRLIKIN